MIRFIDIRNQGTGYRFSFWNTTTDRYVSIQGNYAWSSWREFEEDSQVSTTVGLADLERYGRLCPEWVHDG